MRSTKMVLSIVALALVATALIGSASAAADVFCEEAVGAAEECPALKVVGEGKHVIGVTPVGTKAQLLNASKEVLMECSAKLSTLGFENMGGQTSFLSTVEEWSFSGCTGICKKVLTINLTYKFELVALEFMGTSAAAASAHLERGSKAAAASALNAATPSPTRNS